MSSWTIWHQTIPGFFTFLRNALARISRLTHGILYVIPALDAVHRNYIINIDEPRKVYRWLDSPAYFETMFNDVRVSTPLQWVKMTLAIPSRSSRVACCDKGFGHLPPDPLLPSFPPGSFPQAGQGSHQLHLQLLINPLRYHDLLHQLDLSNLRNSAATAQVGYVIVIDSQLDGGRLPEPRHHGARSSR